MVGLYSGLALRHARPHLGDDQSACATGPHTAKGARIAEKRTRRAGQEAKKVTPPAATRNVATTEGLNVTLYASAPPLAPGGQSISNEWLTCTAPPEGVSSATCRTTSAVRTAPVPIYPART
jgi:hypothetical protein